MRQAQILILEILNVFLWLKFSPSLNLNKNEHFSKVSDSFLTGKLRPSGQKGTTPLPGKCPVPRCRQREASLSFGFNGIQI